MSMPSMRPALITQASTARPTSEPASASWPRSATGRGCGSRADSISSGCPRELGLGEPGLALVLDAEGADLRALRLRHREVGPHRVEHAEAPVALRHHLRCVGDRSDLQAADVGPIDLTLADVEDERHAAEVIGSAVVQGQVAGTHELARAGLDVAPLETPSHRSLPPERPPL